MLYIRQLTKEGMATITGLGGFGEVGRQSVMVENNGSRFLLDYGINVQTSQPPLDPPLPLHAVLLSHAHLDHCGSIPALYARGYTGSVYATAVTIELTKLLLADSHKVQQLKGQQPLYTLGDMETMWHMAREVPYGKRMALENADAFFFDAGHIPGSAMTLLETGGKRMLYTGDIKFSGTELSGGAFSDYSDIDVLITESTYSHMNHPERKQLKKELREHVQDIVSNSGSVIIPVFSVGRAQDMLLMLYDLNIPVYMDGLGVHATRIVLSHPSFLSRPKELKKAFSAAHKVKNGRQRMRVLDRPGIVITSAGMLQGGPVKFYIRSIMKREECSLVINGYQMEGAPGRVLLDTGRYVDEEMDAKPSFGVKFMDFSVHCGRDSLLKFIRKVSPGKVLLTHGEHTADFSEELKGMGFEALAPANGVPLTI